MKKYPIFKHLIQFSNLVDTEGNFVAGAEIETKTAMIAQEEIKGPTNGELNGADDQEKESDGAYEGGESDQAEQVPKQNGTGVSSQINNNLPQPNNMLGGLKSQGFENSQQ